MNRIALTQRNTWKVPAVRHLWTPDGRIHDKVYDESESPLSFNVQRIIPSHFDNAIDMYMVPHRRFS